MRKMPRMVRQISVSPPKTPPTIGPMLFDFGSADAGIRFDVDDGNDKSGEVLALEVRGVELIEDKLLPVLEADVVVASTAFGSAKRLSVFASLPQAMYSNDRSGPLIKSAVEQNCLDSLETLSQRSTLSLSAKLWSHQP
jgi:hypothetical protein